MYIETQTRNPTAPATDNLRNMRLEIRTSDKIPSGQINSKFGALEQNFRKAKTKHHTIDKFLCCGQYSSRQRPTGHMGIEEGHGCRLDTWAHGRMRSMGTFYVRFRSFCISRETYGHRRTLCTLVSTHVLKACTLGLSN